MFKPLLLLVGLTAGGIGCVVVISCAITARDAAGRPMDWAGDGIKCPHCASPLTWLRAHEYRCSGCSRGVTARMSEDRSAILFDE